MSFTVENLENELSLIKRNFIDNLNRSIVEIESHAQKFVTNPKDEDIFFEFKRHLHNLVGSSALFKLTALSAKAREIEVLVMSTDTGRTSHSFKERLHSHIIALRSIVYRTVNEDNHKSMDKYNLDSVLTIPPLKVLIVTDDKQFESIIRVDMSLNHHNLTFCDNGIDALELFDSSQFDLIILEISLPIMDGFDTAKEIRNRQSEFFVPILFITSENRDNYLTRCIDVGGDDFLVKPYSIGILNAKIFSLHRLASKINIALMYNNSESNSDSYQR